MEEDVILPCDLPSWKAVKEYFLALQAEVDGTPLRMEDLVVAMLRIYDISNVSPEGDLKSEACRGLPEAIISEFQTFLEKGLTNQELVSLLQKTIPCMARYALSLPILRSRKSDEATRKLTYCPTGRPFRKSLDRRFVASLIANVFFSTFPAVRKKPDDLDAGSILLEGFWIKVDLRVLMKSGLLNQVFTYFDVLDQELPCGHIVYERSILKGALEMDPWTLQKPLTSVYIIEYPESLAEDTRPNTASFALRSFSSVVSRSSEDDLGCATTLDHPELVPVLLFCQEPGHLDQDVIMVSEILILPSQIKEQGCGGGSSVLTDAKGELATITKLIDQPAFVPRGSTSTLLQELLDTLWCFSRISKQSEACRQPAASSTSSVSSKSSLLDGLADDLPNCTGSQSGRPLLPSSAECERCLSGDLDSHDLKVFRQDTNRRWISPDTLLFIQKWSKPNCCRDPPGNLRDANRLRSFSTPAGLASEDVIVRSPSAGIDCDLENSEDGSCDPVIVSCPRPDSLRFLLQWYAASVEEVPLLIYQIQSSGEALSKEEVTSKEVGRITSICSKADKEGWTTDQLLEVIVEAAAEDCPCDEDSFDYLCNLRQFELTLLA